MEMWAHPSMVVPFSLCLTRTDAAVFICSLLSGVAFINCAVMHYEVDFAQRADVL